MIFFGKTIFSGRLEKENMVFRAVCDGGIKFETLLKEVL